MRNKIYYIYIFIGLCVGAILTAWGYNAATAEREEKASSLCAHEWQNGVSAEDYEKHCRGKYTSSPIDPVEFKTCTRCGLIKMTHIESAEIPERSLQLDNQEEIDWTLFDTTEPNLIFVFAEESVLDWSVTLTTTGDWTINADSGCELVLKTNGPDIEIIGDPNCYEDVIKTMLTCFIQQQESQEFWRNTNQKLLRDALDMADEVIENTDRILEETKELIALNEERIIAMAVEIAEDVVMEVGENIKRELAVTE